MLFYILSGQSKNYIFRGNDQGVRLEFQEKFYHIVSKQELKRTTVAIHPVLYYGLKMVAKQSEILAITQQLQTWKLIWEFTISQLIVWAFNCPKFCL
jgi:hypothetical protein